MTEPTERDREMARAWITDDGRHQHFVARMADADQIGALLAVAREEGRREERERCVRIAEETGSAGAGVIHPFSKVIINRIRSGE